MSDRMKRTETDDFNRNKNVLIIGGSGSGKTRFYIKPNLMQLHSSYVITDPKGSLIHETGKMLSDAGYKIKVFDLINRDKSDLYNPFEYIKNEDDILKIINNLIANTNAPQSKSAGDFWEKSEVALLEAIFGYIFFVFPRKEDKTIANAMEMLRLAEVKEDNEEYQSPLDIMFAELKEKDPDHFAVRQYDIYKFAPEKTAKSILISVGVRLAAFNIPSIRRIVSGDTIGLDMIGSEKTALFIILPDTDKSFNFLAAMMFQQLFDILVYRADNDYKGKLPFHVRCLMDEFSNIGQIPQLEVLISTIRSRGISLNIVLQNLAQIKNLYKDTWEIITGNCDSLLFLGGMEQSTLEYIWHLDIKVQTQGFEQYLSDNVTTLLTDDEQERFNVLMDVGAYTAHNELGNPFGDEDYYISSRWGWRIHPISGQVKMHTGIDIPKSGGTPIHNVMAGTVSFVGYDADGYGNYCTVTSANGERQVLYAHMQSVAVTQGQTVIKGDIIGYVGTTGSSTGNHLHLEYSIENGFRTNPAFYIDGIITP